MEKLVEHEQKNANNDAKIESAEGTGKPKKGDKPEAVSFSQLFRFSTWSDKILMIIGSFGAAAVGAAMPIFSIIFGDIMNSLALSTPDKVTEEVVKSAGYFLILGAVSAVTSWMGLGFWMWAGERQARRVRVLFFQAVLRQNLAWFDENKSGAVSNSLAADTLEYTNGIGEKIATLIQQGSTFLVGIVIGFVKGWQLTLVVLAVAPIMAFVGGLMSKVMVSATTESQEAYGRAGVIAEETFQSIKTVSAFHRQKAQLERYTYHLRDVVSSGVRRSTMQGATMGMFNLVMFGSYGLCMWFGVWLIRNKVVNAWSGQPYNGGDVMTVFFSIIIGAGALGRVAPSIEAIATAGASAFRLYKVIDRVPPIDVYSASGTKVEKIEEIAFQNVDFEYPSRPGVPIYSKFNMRVGAGQRVALVGGTGSGKSTIIGLLERFYDPTSGAVLINGTPLTDLNLHWWRQQVGLVSQEPVLFDGTVLDNIRFGRPEATEEEVIAAAKAANAHEFITKLRGDYQASVGEGGSRLSGGQKQRIAIARTIITQPKVLLLDEATSALDNESERLVQRALDSIMVGRTTFVVAHRLSTIVHCDCIYVLDKGKIVEQGTHSELLALDGAYARLIHAQEKAADHPPPPADSADPSNPSDASDAYKLKADATQRLKEEEEEAVVDGEVKLDANFNPAHPLLIEDASPGAQEGPRLSVGEEVKQVRIDMNQGSEHAGKDSGAKEPSSPPISSARVWKMCAPDAGYLAVGFVGAAMGGAAMPLFALIFGSMTSVFYDFDPVTQDRSSALWALCFLALGVGMFLAGVSSEFGFGVVGQRLTLRLRTMVFTSIIRQEMGWFDEGRHNSRVLAGKLATEASLVEGGTTKQGGQSVQIAVTLGVGLGISFYYSWKVALVVLACGPLLVGTGAIQMKLMTGFSNEGQKAFEAAGKHAGEIIGNLRTVASFVSEKRVVKQFDLLLKPPMKVGTKKAHISGVAMGASQFCTFGVHAVTWWFASTLVANGELTFEAMMKAVFAIFMAAMSVGFISSLTPDMQKANAAKNDMFALIDRKSCSDPFSPEGDLGNFTKGEIIFKDVQFAYPTAPDLPVLRGVSMRVNPGETVALVGTSGSGKSTVMGLLLRLYDLAVRPAGCTNPDPLPNHLLGGQIFIDGVDISTMQLEHLRHQIGLVAQEPSLFDMTIEDNIRVGSPQASDTQVVAAARAANVDDFIDSLPLKYKTQVGVRGTQLSGGQKQRIAIARALIRTPKVLLLDEATSALDAESERVVQEALDKLMQTKERTIVVIAHRLSTVRHADKIAVLHAGKLREMGSHDQLMALNGLYAKLVRMPEQH